MSTRHRAPSCLVGLVLALAAGSGCAAPVEGEEVAQTTEEALFKSPWTPTWATQGNYVRVCFTEAGWDSEKSIVKRAIERTWGRSANLSFAWRSSPCPTTGTRKYLKIDLSAQTANADGTYRDQGGQGRCAEGQADSFRAPNQAAECHLWVRPDHLVVKERLEYLAVHEIGHALGFRHEQDRPDNPHTVEGVGCNDTRDPAAEGTLYSVFDRRSVMSYCGPNDGALTNSDVSGVRRAYGAPVLPRVGDVDGDGLDDVVVRDPDGLGILRVNRAAGNALEAFVTAKHGVHHGGWYLAPDDDVMAVADFTGDGKADLLVRSGWGYGVLSQLGAGLNGTSFAQFGTSLGGGWTLHEEDAIVAVGRFSGGTASEMIVRSTEGFGLLARDPSSGALVLRARIPLALPVGSWTTFREDTTIVGAKDFDGDGRDDLLLRTSSGIALVKYLPATRRWTTLATQPFSTRIGWWFLAGDDQVSGVADMNQDGRAELVIRSGWGLGIASFVPGQGFRLVTGQQHDTTVTGGWYLGRHDDVAGAGMFNPWRTDLLMRGPSGIGLVGLDDQNRLTLKQFHAHAARMGWWFFAGADRIEAVGRFGAFTSGMLIKSEWGVGVLHSTSGAFQVTSGHMFGSALRGWTLESNDTLPAR